MKRLTRVAMVQFFLYDDALDIDIRGNTAFVGQNGCGKSTLLDAIQIVLMGVHGNYVALNAQSLGGGRGRSIRDYCLGVTFNDGSGGQSVRVRPAALSYISLTFTNEIDGQPVSIGVCLSATVENPKHNVEGLFICAGADLHAADMVEKVDGSTYPLPWSQFEQIQRRRARTEGYRFDTGTGPQNFVKKYLHHLQDEHHHIDPDRFLRSLRESLQLRYTDDIDGFVRNHVVTADRIDVTKCAEQIHHFERLRTLVQNIRDRLSELQGLRGRFDAVRDSSERAACLLALKEHISLAEANETIAAGELTLSGLDLRVANLQHELETTHEAAKDTERDYLRISTQISQNPTLAKRRDIATQLTQLRESRDASDRALHVRLERVRQVLRSLPNDLAITGTNEYREVIELVDLALSDSTLTSGDIEEVARDLTPILEQAYVQIESAQRLQDQRVLETEKRLEELRGRQLVLRRGGADPPLPAARLIQMLATNGIVASPICDLVRVTEREWQPAIEAFLGRNRWSLVVQAGAETRAISLTRTGAVRQAAYEVTLVQPAHLSAADDRATPGSVAALIHGDDTTAVRYVRMLLGRMQRVQTNEELQSASRALTVDGMLSANGGTRPLRLISPQDLLLGRARDDAAIRRVEEALRDAELEDLAARSLRDRLRNLLKALGPVADSGFEVAVSEAAVERDRLVAQVTTLEEMLQGLVSGKTSDLLKLETNARGALEKLRTTIERLNRDVGAVQTERDNASRNVQIFRNLAEQAEKRIADAEAQKYFSAEVLGRVTELITRSASSPADRIRECDRVRERAVREEEQKSHAALADLRAYADRNKESFAVNILDWPTAAEKVLHEIERLRDTGLVEREREAEQARQRAEESFRRDVALKLRDKILTMKADLRKLDRMLRDCPAFSNGERYAFDARPVEHLRKVLDFILTFGETNENPNLFDTDELSTLITGLIEDSISEGSTVDISDYRLFFRFDLLIERDGSQIGRLSKRIGTGSGGEHRTPLFVVAGAALANAYRIDVARPNNSFGLMLIDEAFHGMDPQNTLAVARFLSKIGLQVVLAAPDSETGKFLPFCDRIYDMIRSDDRVYMESTDLTADAQRLATSDMPSEHPELLKAAQDSLSAAS